MRQLALARSEVQELKGRAEHAPKSLGPKAARDELPWAKEIVVEERLSVTSEVPDLPAFEEPEPAAVPEPDTEVRVLNQWQRHVFTFDDNGAVTEVTHWIDGVEAATVESV